MDDYVEDRLGGRRIFWCPGGQGNLAHCPQPTDPDDYTYCCTYYYLSKDLPSCCRWPWHTGAIIALLLAAIVITLLFALFTCWCCPWCPLARRIMANQEFAALHHGSDNAEQLVAKASNGEDQTSRRRFLPAINYEQTYFP